MTAEMYIEGFGVCEETPQAQDFAAWFEGRRLRRLDELSLRLLLASCRALTRAGMQTADEKPFGLSLGVGAGSLQSTCKFIDSILQDGDELSSPTAFAGSVHNAAGLCLSLFLNLRGPCVTVGQFNNSFGAALLTAQSFLAARQAPYVLVAVADSLNPVARDLCGQFPSALSKQKEENWNFSSAAAFLVSPRRTPHSLACLSRFEFFVQDPHYVSPRAQEWAPLAARPAAELCRALSGQEKHFSLRFMSQGVCTFLQGENLHAD